MLMHPAELPRANTIQRAAAAAGLAQLSEQDYCGILTYTKPNVNWVWKGPEIAQVANRHDELLSMIQESSTEDLQEFDPALRMALEELLKIPNVRRRMLILTDGDPAPPARETIQRFKDAGIPITVVHADIHRLGERGAGQTDGGEDRWKVLSRV